MSRQILHDPVTYVDPMEFNPERFLGNHPEPEPRAAAFGYGRRICKCCEFVILPFTSLVALRPDLVGPIWTGSAGWLPILILHSFPTYSCYFPRRPRSLISCVCVAFLTGPGIHLAHSSIWLACAMSLSVFDVQKYVDGFGNVIEPKTLSSDGIIR